MNQHTEHFKTEDSFDISKALSILWNSKYRIIGFTLACIIFSIVYSLSLPNIYTSSAILKINDESASQTSSIISQYTGIASMAGISLPSKSADKMQYAIQTLKSKEFVKSIIFEEDNLPNLMAAKEYDYKNKNIIYDETIYDASTKKWLRSPNQGRYSKPSYVEVFETSYNSNYSARKDMKSGFLIVSFSHISPQFSYSFLKKSIEMLNKISREKDLSESQQALDYLYKKLSEVEQKEVRESINALIESQLKIQMLGNIREDYLVSLIDPPFLPETKSSPKRSQIVILATILGFMFAILIVFIRETVFVNESKGDL